MDGARRVNATTMAGGPPAKTWRLVGFRDLNGDEQPDFLWQNHTAIAAWFLQQHTNRLSAALLRNSSTAWQIVTMADFNNDEQADCLWQNGRGQVAVSLLEGTNFVSTILLRNGIAVSGGWRAVGAADFNGDGETDILWQNNAGQLAVWFMNETTFLNAAVVRPGYNAVPDWRLAGLGDVDGDGNTDFLWQHTGGQLAAWLMDGVTFVRSLSLNGAQPVVAGSRMVDVTK
jgi:hypothetical protein